MHSPRMHHLLGWVKKDSRPSRSNASEHGFTESASTSIDASLAGYPHSLHQRAFDPVVALGSADLEGSPHGLTPGHDASQPHGTIGVGFLHRMLGHVLGARDALVREVVVVTANIQCVQ